MKNEKSDDKDVKKTENGQAKNSSELLTELEERIVIPEEWDTYEGIFSFRKLWLFTGPGWLMSIAYLDPGNIESDLQSGAIAEYRLLWVTLWATVIGVLMQRLCARLGVVTGKHLAEVCYEKYPKIPRIFLWLMVEVAIIGADIQEVVGTAFALYLLSSKAIKLWVGTLITIVDTFTFLFLDRYGLRKLEFFFALLIAIMAFSFGYNYFIDIPNQGDIMEGLFVPVNGLRGTEEVKQAVAAIGAIIMPHNLYLHSALVKTRQIDRQNPRAVSEANKYFLIESCIALFISFILNLFVITVYGHNFYGVTYEEAYYTCSNSSSIYTEDFFSITENNPEDLIESNLLSGGAFLGCTFGMACTYIWAVGIFAAGQSSTMTGTYSGQFAMEGFLNIQWPRWKRILVCRLIAIAPTVVITSVGTIKDATLINDYMNIVMFLVLPFAIIPTITFTSSRFIMGEFTNGTFTKIYTTVLTILMIGIQLYFCGDQVFSYLSDTHWIVYVAISIAIFLYLVFVLYLFIYMLINLGFEKLVHYKLIQKMYNVQEFIDDCSPVSPIVLTTHKKFSTFDED